MFTTGELAEKVKPRHPSLPPLGGRPSAARARSDRAGTELASAILPRARLARGSSIAESRRIASTRTGIGTARSKSPSRARPGAASHASAESKPDWSPRGSTDRSWNTVAIVNSDLSGWRAGTGKNHKAQSTHAAFILETRDQPRPRPGAWQGKRRVPTSLLWARRVVDPTEARPPILLALSVLGPGDLRRTRGQEFGTGVGSKLLWPTAGATNS
jgi:hypothetical protein